MQKEHKNPGSDALDTENNDYDKLFHRYLVVCNKAIEKHKDNFPYKEIWGAGFRPFMEGYKHSFTLYDNRPKGTYNIGMTDNTQLEELGKTTHEPERCWPLKYSYLQHVVNNAEEHIENPSKLDWTWLKAMGE